MLKYRRHRRCYCFVCVKTDFCRYSDNMFRDKHALVNPLVGLVDLWVEVGWICVGLRWNWVKVGWIWVGLGPAHGWVGWAGL